MNENLCFFEGFLGGEPLVKRFASGKVVASCVLSVNERIKKGQDYETRRTYINIEAWGDKAEQLAKVSKNAKVNIHAKYKKQGYDKDGEKRYKHYFLVTRLSVIKKESYSVADQTDDKY